MLRDSNIESVKIAVTIEIVMARSFYGKVNTQILIKKKKKQIAALFNITF